MDSLYGEWVIGEANTLFTCQQGLLPGTRMSTSCCCNARSYRVLAWYLHRWTFNWSRSSF
jgi:hypothetical protein